MSFEAPEPPPVYVPGPPPAYTSPPAQYSPPQRPTKPKPKGLWGAILAALAAIGKFIAPILKFAFPILKFGKVALLTGGTMLISVWAYAMLFGWQFAVGFVLCIFVHEMGHVVFAKIMGLPVSAPVFIPFMGALIMLKQTPRNSFIDSFVGIGGPLFGTLSGLACWGIYTITGNYLFLGLAFTAFFMNLFNLTPMYPLDGGRIVSVISPWIWLVGLVMMVTMFAMGMVHNPIIFILVIMSIPQLWTRLRNRKLHQETVPNNLRITMAAAYIGLAGFLFWAMAATHIDPTERLKARNHTQVAGIAHSPHVG